MLSLKKRSAFFEKKASKSSRWVKEQEMGQRAGNGRLGVPFPFPWRSFPLPSLSLGVALGEEGSRRWVKEQEMGQGAGDGTFTCLLNKANKGINDGDVTLASLSKKPHLASLSKKPHLASLSKKPHLAIFSKKPQLRLVSKKPQLGVASREDLFLFYK
jgi:hypothetical protein